MSHPPETRICPICHSLLWEEDFLHPEDLEVWEEVRRRADTGDRGRRRRQRLAGRGGNGHGGDSEAELLELAELILELLLTLDAEH